MSSDGAGGEGLGAGDSALRTYLPMAFGIYKPGQGYWVRVMSASLAGAMTLALAAWLWAQVGTIAIPRPEWRLTLSPSGGRAVQGAEVELLGRAPTEGASPIPIGRAVIQDEVDAAETGVRVSIRNIRLAPEYLPTDIVQIRAVDGGVEGLTGTVVGMPRGVPIIEPVLLQAGVAGLVLLLGAVLTYWLVGVKENTVEFLIATDGEMKKVNWSTRKDIIGSTQVVLLWTVLIAGGLYLVDIAFSQFFSLIGVLE